MFHFTKIPAAILQCCSQQKRCMDITCSQCNRTELRKTKLDLRDFKMRLSPGRPTIDGQYVAYIRRGPVDLKRSWTWCAYQGISTGVVAVRSAGAGGRLVYSVGPCTRLYGSLPSGGISQRQTISVSRRRRRKRLKSVSGTTLLGAMTMTWVYKFAICECKRIIKIFCSASLDLQ